MSALKIFPVGHKTKGQRWQRHYDKCDDKENNTGSDKDKKENQSVPFKTVTFSEYSEEYSAHKQQDVHPETFYLEQESVSFFKKLEAAP